MSGDLGRLTTTRKLGTEPFLAGAEPLPFSLLHFWQWLGSDLVGNTFRGALAEYLVAQALGIAGSTRDEWGACDLCIPEGPKIEVKSAAYLQSWSQRAPSAISFGVRRTRAWDPDTNIMSTDVRRQADVYVFALLAHRDKQTLNPLDVTQWTFYVLPTAVLNEHMFELKRVTLQALLRLTPRQATFSELAAAVREVGTNAKSA
jgi:hypothetical protein